jgi:hypothetical protein
MNLAEQLLAGITATVCVVLLVRLCLSPARQHRFDRAMRTIGWKIRVSALHVWHWRLSRRAAEREAQAAIERARHGRATGEPDDGEWKGNVYTPKSFRKPRKPH